MTCRWQQLGAVYRIAPLVDGLHATAEMPSNMSTMLSHLNIQCRQSHPVNSSVPAPFSSFPLPPPPDCSISTTVGSYLLSVKLAGYMYDLEVEKERAHSLLEGIDSASLPHKCLGPKCFRNTFLIMAGVCLVGVTALFRLTARTRRLYQVQDYCETSEPPPPVACMHSVPVCTLCLYALLARVHPGFLCIPGCMQAGTVCSQRLKFCEVRFVQPVACLYGECNCQQE